MTGLLLLAAVGNAEATEIGNGRSFGLGLQLGQPFGITGKAYTSGRSNAIDFTVGTYYASGYYYDGFQAQVAYHWHLVELTSGERPRGHR